MLKNLEDQNKKLEGEITELTETMQSLFGDKIMESKKESKIDYKNIKNESIVKKVEREREEKKKSDQFADLKRELAQITKEYKGIQAKIMAIKSNDDKNRNREQVE